MVKSSNGRLVRLNVNHILYYSTIQTDEGTYRSTRIQITEDDFIEVEGPAEEIDMLIEEATP
jgi:hypothetical protein